MNELKTLRDAIVNLDSEVLVDPRLGARAMAPLQRMLNFSAARA